MASLSHIRNIYHSLGRTIASTTSAATPRVLGTVKWYNRAKGYGFLWTDEGTEVFVHHGEIKMDGFRYLRDGERVEFSMIQKQTDNAASPSSTSPILSMSKNRNRWCAVAVTGPGAQPFKRPAPDKDPMIVGQLLGASVGKQLDIDNTDEDYDVDDYSDGRVQAQDIKTIEERANDKEEDDGDDDEEDDDDDVDDEDDDVDDEDDDIQKK